MSREIAELILFDSGIDLLQRKANYYASSTILYYFYFTVIKVSRLFDSILPVSLYSIEKRVSFILKNLTFTPPIGKHLNI